MNAPMNAKTTLPRPQRLLLEHPPLVPTFSLRKACSNERAESKSATTNQYHLPQHQTSISAHLYGIWIWYWLSRVSVSPWSLNQGLDKTLPRPSWKRNETADGAVVWVSNLAIDSD
jgi:hypothetical protein